MIDAVKLDRLLLQARTHRLFGHLDVEMLQRSTNRELSLIPMMGPRTLREIRRVIARLENADENVFVLSCVQLQSKIHDKEREIAKVRLALAPLEQQASELRMLLHEQAQALRKYRPGGDAQQS